MIAGTFTDERPADGFGQFAPNIHADSVSRAQPKLRIALVTDRMTPGGVSQVMLQIAGHFSEQGHRVDVVAVRPGEWDHRFAKHGIEIHILPSVRALSRIRRADVVHCQQRIMGLLSVLLGARRRTVEHVHNEMSNHKTLSFRAPTLVAVSDQIRRDLQQSYPRLRGADITVVRNGVRKLPGKPPSFSGRPNDLIAVGRLEEQKDPLRFLEVVHDLRIASPMAIKSIWLAPGDGALMRQFLDRRAELGLRDCVELIIGGSHDATRQLIARSKVLVMTSKWEGLPLAGLEALASGTPVVTTECGEIGEIVRRVSCGALLMGPADTGTSVLDQMTRDASVWAGVSAAALEAAGELSEESMLQAIGQIYCAVGESRPQRTPDAAPDRRGER